MNKKLLIGIIIIIITTIGILIAISSLEKEITFDGYSFEAINGFNGWASEGGKVALLNDGSTELKVFTKNSYGILNTEQTEEYEFRENKSVNGISYLYVSFKEINHNGTIINVYFTKNGTEYGITTFVDYKHFNDATYMKSLNQTLEHIITTIHKL